MIKYFTAERGERGKVEGGGNEGKGGEKGRVEKMRGGRGREGLLNLKSHVDELKGYTEDNLNRLLVVKPGAM